MMINVYLIRHAESAANVDEDNTEPDVGLTPFGWLQASRIAIDVNIVMVSPLKRTLDTLRASKITGPCAVDARLREWKQDPCDFLLGEELLCETEDILVDRVRSVIATCNSLAANSNVALVTHGDWITYFILLVGASLDDYPGNASVHVVQLRRGGEG